MLLSNLQIIIEINMKKIYFRSSQVIIIKALTNIELFKTCFYLTYKSLLK